MKLYIKEKVFSWTDQFTVKDEKGNDKYRVEGELFSWGKKLHVYDMNGFEAVCIKQKVFTFLPLYQVFCEGEMIAEIKKEFSFLFPRYTIAGLDWEIEGRFMAHDYQITQNGETIAVIRKEWMTWGDSYELDILYSHDELTALAVVLTIDCVMESSSGVSVTISNN